MRIYQLRCAGAIRDADSLLVNARDMTASQRQFVLRGLQSIPMRPPYVTSYKFSSDKNKIEADQLLRQGFRSFAGKNTPVGFEESCIIAFRLGIHVVCN